jgi:hypothetical protein
MASSRGGYNAGAEPASVDPTDARNSDTGFRVRQPDVAKPIELAVHARWPHPLPMRVFRQANVHDPVTD